MWFYDESRMETVLLVFVHGQTINIARTRNVLPPSPYAK